AKGFPYAGTYIGLEEIAKNVFDRLGSEWINYTFTPDTYVADGNIVVAIDTYTGTYKKTNKAFSARVAHFWTLEKRKIVSFEQIVDSKTVAEALNN
uniref:nuclear transport factor 2 family protein n=1 Tax=Cellulophaga fucicola TaxID=76595 RepID=UPI003EBCF7F6